MVHGARTLCGPPTRQLLLQLPTSRSVHNHVDTPTLPAGKAIASAVPGVLALEPLFLFHIGVGGALWWKKKPTSRPRHG